MFKYVETIDTKTNEVLRRMDVSIYSERVASTFVNAANNGIRNNDHQAILKHSEKPLEIGNIIEMELS